MTASAQTQPTFRADTRLVEVNVLVQESNGRPLEGLTRDDFTLLEDGKPQTIDLFNIEASRPAVRTAEIGAAPPSASAPLGSRVFSNRFAARPGGVTVVVFDRLNTPWEDQRRARDQIIKALSEFQPQDRVALYVLESDSLRVLHDFTSDTASLRATLARFRGASSRELEASVDTPLPDASTGNAAVDAEFKNWLDATMREVSAVYLRRRAEYTMDAFEGVAHRLAGVRGRKNLVWVSSSFPLQYQDRFGPQTMGAFLDRASRAINDADIAVYGIDPHGVVTPAMGAAGMRTQEVDRAHRTAADDARVTGLLTEVDKSQATDDTLQYLSNATGGRAIKGNDAGQAIRQAAADSRMSYVLGYYPAATAWDGRYRSIKVIVNRPGAIVRSRTGYVATRFAAAADPAMATEVLLAAMRNPFEATGIELNAKAERVAGGDPAARQLRIELGFAAPNLTLEKKGDDWEGVLDLAIAQSTASGQTFKTFSAKADLRFTAEQHERLLRDGFRFERVIVLRPDSARVQVVVRDVPSGAIGSVIIPAAALR